MSPQNKNVNMLSLCLLGVKSQFDQKTDVIMHVEDDDKYKQVYVGKSDLIEFENKVSNYTPLFVCMENRSTLMLVLRKVVTLIETV